MKRKVIRVCSLVLLSVAVSIALGGCGSKSEKDTAASSTTSTSKVVKSSAKTQTSEKQSAKKAKTEASKDFQGQKEASAPEASSSKNQVTAGNDAQGGTSSSASKLYNCKSCSNFWKSLCLGGWRFFYLASRYYRPRGSWFPS